jgi:adenylate cyclase
VKPAKATGPHDPVAPIWATLNGSRHTCANRDSPSFGLRASARHTAEARSRPSIDRVPDRRISLNAAARIAGVSPATLKRWASARVIPVRRDEWTVAAAAQARVVARMRDRGHSLDELRRAVRDGRLAFGFIEDLLPGTRERPISRAEAAERTGLEEELIERVMTLLGTPTALEGTLNDQDVEAIEQMATVLGAGFPLVAMLQLIRVYAQSIRKIAEAEVRLFHLYVHEPLIHQGVDALEMSEEMEDLARELLPLTSPLMEYIHQRYLQFYIEQDVVGHMETDFGDIQQMGRVTMAFCFVDLTGFVRYTEEEGDEEALDLIERFVETVEATLPAEALIVKTIGDEVMIVSPDPVTLTEWAVGFLGLFQERPQPRVGLHYGRAVYRDGDYFGTEVNLTHRVVARALGGEVMVTRAVADAIGDSAYLEFDPIGRVELKGFPRPAELLVARAVEPGGE